MVAPNRESGHPRDQKPYCFWQSVRLIFKGFFSTVATVHKQKIVTGRGDRELSANMESFIKAVQVSDIYKPILKEYIVFGNKIRHAGKDGQPKPHLTRKEVESFVYMTGVFIRIAVIEEAQA